MKNFILAIGEMLLNIFVVIGVLFAVIAIFTGGASGLAVSIVIIVTVTMVTFLLFLLIDIRDKSNLTNDLLKKILEEKVDSKLSNISSGSDD